MDKSMRAGTEKPKWISSSCPSPVAHMLSRRRKLARGKTKLRLVKKLHIYVLGIVWLKPIQLGFRCKHWLVWQHCEV